MALDKERPFPRCFDDQVGLNSESARSSAEVPGLTPGWFAMPHWPRAKSYTTVTIMQCLQRQNRLLRQRIHDRRIGFPDDHIGPPSGGRATNSIIERYPVEPGLRSAFDVPGGCDIGHFPATTKSHRCRVFSIVGVSNPKTATSASARRSSPPALNPGQRRLPTRKTRPGNVMQR